MTTIVEANRQRVTFIEERAEILTDSWLNGNHTHVLDELVYAQLPDNILGGALLIMIVHHKLHTIAPAHGRDFRDQLERRFNDLYAGV